MRPTPLPGWASPLGTHRGYITTDLCGVLACDLIPGERGAGSVILGRLLSLDPLTRPENGVVPVFQGGQGNYLNPGAGQIAANLWPGFLYL